MKDQWLQFRRFIVHGILHADDTPHAIALGVALATFVAIVPVIGLQTVVALALAAAFRANKAVCIPIVWISNPITALPINYACLWIGRLILPGDNGESIMQAIHRLSGVGGGLSLFSLAFWKERVIVLAGLGLELWVGSIVVGAVLGAIAYPLTRWGVETYRVRHRHRLELKGMRSPNASQIQVASPALRDRNDTTESCANSVQQHDRQSSKNKDRNPGGQGGGGVRADVLGDEGHDVAKPAHEHALTGVAQHIRR